MSARIGLVDMYNVFIRMYVAVPQMDVNGEPIGGITGTLKCMGGIARDLKLTDMVAIWDGEGGSAKRRAIYSEYKAGRRVRLNREFDSNDGATEDVKNMLWQQDTLRRYLDMLGVKQVQVPGCEADDILAYYVTGPLVDETSYVVTNDKDMLQLVRPGCSVYNHTKKRLYDVAQVQGEWFCLPQNLPLLRSILGDGSDNIPGIKGIGPKTAHYMFPELNERSLGLDELLDIVEKRIEKVEQGGTMSKASYDKYTNVLQSEDLLRRNMSLMKLGGGLLSAPAGRSARLALEKNAPCQSLAFRMALLREGVQTKDDLGSEFAALAQRRAYSQIKKP
jgi:5'-3' exonuclease